MSHFEKPLSTVGLRHVALYVKELEVCVAFYVELLDMKIEWQPDADNVYLTSGNDNLALHRASTAFDANSAQRLDHIGFIIATAAQVDDWFNYLKNNNVTMRNGPRTHRDGARSFYCFDPDGTVVQMMYHPPIS